jgi:transglutaminase-like putative cysteine protease
MWSDGTVEDSGTPDPAVPEAAEIPVADLPDDCLLYLMGSRYCETDKLSQIAWDQFGAVAPGWERVQAICDFVNGHITFGYQNARATRTAFDAYRECVGVCRD